jgi:hypothetical protein
MRNIHWEKIGSKHSLEHYVADFYEFHLNIDVYSKVDRPYEWRVAIHDRQIAGGMNCKSANFAKACATQALKKYLGQRYVACV